MENKKFKGLKGKDLFEALTKISFHSLCGKRVKVITPCKNNADFKDKIFFVASAKWFKHQEPFDDNIILWVKQGHPFLCSELELIDELENVQLVSPRENDG